MLISTPAVFAYDVKVEVNGNILETDAKIVEDRTMVPLRAVSNALGCGVAWDAENQGITIVRSGENSSEDLYMVLTWIDKPRAFKMYKSSLDEGTVMDVAPKIIDDRTYVPIRAVAELFGADVSWNGDMKTAVIKSEIPELIYTDDVAEALINYEAAMNSVYDEYDRYLSGAGEIVNAQITLSDDSKINLELYPELAPITVANFVSLANSNYYDGLTFHRVIEDFMIQGGGFYANGSAAKTTDPIVGEFLSNNIVNFIPHKRGAISMARTSVNDSATGQFFIMHADGYYLDGNYAAFGKVTSGMEYVDAIATVDTDLNDKPIDDIVIKSIEIK